MVKKNVLIEKNLKHMKKLLFLFAFIGLTHVTMQAQVFKWGVRVGLSTPDIKPKDVNPLTLKNSTDSFTLKLSDARYGFHFGGWVRLSAARIFLQPEVNFNSTRVNYDLKSLKIGSAINDTVKESFLNLDIPVLVGFKLGGIRLSGGPVGHLHLNSSSEIGDVATDYKAKFKQMTYGYQAGMGVSFGAVGIDIRYEGNFSKFGEHINFGNNSYQFSKTPSRFLVSMAVGF
jgi:hypothetical protein